jgi:hypothetical protein
MSWVITPAYLGAAVSDPDAQAYLRAVETADNQGPLEPGVQQAVNQFVIGCKADGIWSAIKASCILAGARTLAGALVPLVGAAPTNFNFVSGDYNRKTGLVGNGTTTYLNSNRAANADPQNSAHFSVYKTSGTSSGSMLCSLGNNLLTVADYTGVDYFSGNFRFFNRAGIANSELAAGINGLISSSRSDSTGFDYRINGTTVFFNGASSTAPSNNYIIFNRPTGNFFSSNRLAFYSIGESLDLALLDARVTTLVNAFAAAIP